MWVSKTIGTNIDLQVRKNDTMAHIISFTAGAVDYSLAGITPVLSVYKAGNNVPALVINEANGLSKIDNKIIFEKTIWLATGMYRYELAFNFTDPDLVDAIIMDGAFWVRKETVNTTAEYKIAILTEPPEVKASVIVQNISQFIEGPPGPPGASASSLPLTVIADGQTEFNIFTTPENNKHHLEINGVIYYYGPDYTLTTTGFNVRLVWLNKFSLQLSDELYFFKF